MNSPLITVIVPCYKVEKYLTCCIDSIINQTYQNLEILLVDDGSPDRCGVICDEYAIRDKRIKVIHKENGGLSDARNVAIDIAKGEFLTFIDSDDYVSSKHVEVLYRLIEKYHCQLSVSQWQEFRENSEGRVVDKKVLKEIVYDTPQKAVSAMYYQMDFDNAVWGKMYHKSLFENIRFPKGIIYEDDYTVYRLMFSCKKVAYTNKITYYYLLRGDSIEGETFSDKKLDSALTVLKSMEEDHWDLISQVLPAYRSRYLSFCMHLLLKAPLGYNKSLFLWERVKDYRWSVICDRHARPKARVAAFLSYFGMAVVKQIFTLIDKRR